MERLKGWVISSGAYVVAARRMRRVRGPRVFRDRSGARRGQTGRVQRLWPTGRSTVDGRVVSTRIYLQGIRFERRGHAGRSHLFHLIISAAGILQECSRDGNPASILSDCYLHRMCTLSSLIFFDNYI